MNAEVMRGITEKANQQRGVRDEEVRVAAEARRQDEAESTKRRWMTESIPETLAMVRQAAERGLKCYHNTFSECPGYVVEHLKGLGFEVECTRRPRNNYYNEDDPGMVDVLTIRW